MSILESGAKLPAFRSDNWFCHAVILSGFLAAVFPFSLAAGNDANICDRAAETAAAHSNVPISVLKAIARTETGRLHNNEIVPWPWTVNMEGKGVWFETPDAARAYAYKHYKRGARSFDVGCFQLNYKWHHHAFSSIEEMFEPVANANYAASFLTQLYAELGSWESAVGAYHSRTPKHAKRYTKIYFQHLAVVAGMEAQAQKPAQTGGRQKYVNRFPLLQDFSSIRSAGSLASLSGEARGSFFTSAHPIFEPQS